MIYPAWLTMYPVRCNYVGDLGKSLAKGFAETRGRSTSRTIHEKKLDKSVKRNRSINASNTSLDMADHIKPSYYMEQLKYHYSLKNLENETTKKFKEHFLRNLASIRYIKTLRTPSIDNVMKSRMQLAKLEESQQKSRIW